MGIRRTYASPEGAAEPMVGSTTRMLPVKVAVVDDVPDIREGLSFLIAGTSGFECCGSYRTMEEALEGFARVPPDLALLDIRLPGMSGIEGVRRLREAHPSV